LNFKAKRGLNQQGLCFVSTDVWDNSTSECELSCGFNSVYSDVRGSNKVPEGLIILDARVYDILECGEDEEIHLIKLVEKIPNCSELHLDIISKRDLQNQAVANAISDRIDDFKEHFDGLILQTGQEVNLSDLGVSFAIRSMNPIDSTKKAARIVWKDLLKINLSAIETQPSNLYIIVEVAAATQIADVSIDSDVMTRHQAILHTLTALENQSVSYSGDLLFSGCIYSDEVLPFMTFNPQTGEESEITPLDSPSLIAAFRKWFDTSLEEFSALPSNPGSAIKLGLERAHSMSNSNGLPTTIVFFSSGVYSSGQNPVMITRKNKSEKSVKILSISVGSKSATDIMEAIAKETNGKSLHLTDSEKAVAIAKDISAMSRNTE
jgi:hypothetical protein